MRNYIFITLLFLYFTQATDGQNFRQISNREGISNNAVLSLSQDRDGYIWLGTCEGVNIWDGKEMYVFDQTKIKNRNLCSNLIEEFIQTSDSLLWIRTNYGLNKIDPRSKKSEMHPEFSGLYKFTARNSDEVFVATQDNNLYYYNQQEKSFKKIDLDGLNYANLINIYFDESDKLWFFTAGNAYCIPVKYDSNNIEFGKYKMIKLPDGVYHLEIDHKKVFLTTTTGIFYEFNTADQQAIYKADISAEHNKRGDISKIIQDGNDYYISFLTNGLIRLKYTPEKETKYDLENIPINCGIFSLLKDKNQEIIWIGTDGQGLYQYTKSGTVFNSITFDEFPLNITKPIRVLFIDKNDNLWIGTKDDGVLRIKDFYDADVLNSSNTISFNTQNTNLLNNSVYTFSKSRRNLFWMGSDGNGLNYYSYKDNLIHKLNTKNTIAHIHGLIETNDSTLWIVTGGYGVYKLIIGGNLDFPVIKKEIPIFIDKELSTKNLFFSVFQESDSIIWFGNRGGGAVRYNMITGERKIIRFKSPAFQAVNDIFAISRSKDGSMWFGTGSGLIRYSPDEKTKSKLLTKTTIHAMQKDDNENLWISTNNGLIKYSMSENTISTYDYPYGLKVIEYSDGAYFRDEKNQTLFFGGINGFVTIKGTDHEEPIYTPPLLFKDIRINDVIYSVNELSDEHGKIILNFKQNYFTLSIVALDFINGSNYNYQYRMDNQNGHWIENSNLNKISFSNLKPGDYNLEVRYHNNLTDYNSPVYHLKIKILPPWYSTLVFKLIYGLLILLGIGLIIRLFFNQLRKKRLENQKRIDQAQKEEMYESKLRFFTNITQELSTPLTLISGPCQQISGYPNSDEYIKDKALLIQRNASKLNELIYMLNEFKESGSSANMNEIEMIDISRVSHEIARQFVDAAEQDHITFNLDIKENLIWSCDKNRYLEMLSSFLIFAFKNTGLNGEVGLKVHSTNENLLIDLYNVGNQVKNDFLEIIKDRYKILDYLEKNSKKGISYQANLELVISYNLVKNMNGDLAINLQNDGNKLAFQIKLPKLKISKELKSSRQIILPDKSFKLHTIEKKDFPFDKNKPTILLLMENMEIMNFVSGIFDNQYNIEQKRSIEAANEYLKQEHPNIIICCISLQLPYLVEFIKNIKDEKQTSHIPIAVLSTSQQKEEQIEFVESGADICIVLPFDVKYLKAVTEQLLKNSESLKDYYRSSLSSFEMVDGKLLHKEDREFTEKMIQIISENLTNPTISTEFVANEMGISVRNLYRRLEKITDQTPSEIIKDYRLQRAEQLLITSKLSIDEIIYKSGFNNRGTFFKSFSNKYGLTPKVYRETKSDDSSK